MAYYYRVSIEIRIEEIVDGLTGVPRFDLPKSMYKWSIYGFSKALLTGISDVIVYIYYGKRFMYIRSLGDQELMLFQALPSHDSLVSSSATEPFRSIRTNTTNTLIASSTTRQYTSTGTTPFPTSTPFRSSRLSPQPAPSYSPW